MSDRELATQRLLDHPRERVFAAWTDPETLARWWGPAGFTNTFEVCEVRTGGDWRFVMHGPDGRDYDNVSRFLDITPPERIVVEHVSAPHFVLTVTLADEDGRTRVDWRGEFDTATICAQIAKFAVEANEQNLDRLAAVLDAA